MNPSELIAQLEDHTEVDMESCADDRLRGSVLQILEVSKVELRKSNVHRSPASPSGSSYDDTITEYSKKAPNEVEFANIDSGKLAAAQTPDDEVDVETHVESRQDDVPSESFHPNNVDSGSFQHDKS
ncbi:hypothetical protein J3459_017115 [Metarhizium acridum]|nr:hypothetical protein J3459_017115 [Metarhizium acridum]